MTPECDETSGNRYVNVMITEGVRLLPDIFRFLLHHFHFCTTLEPFQQLFPSLGKEVVSSSRLQLCPMEKGKVNWFSSPPTALLT